MTYSTGSATVNLILIVYSIGSASTGSTKSATMELYVASSYNETVSGGETLSSISEKSCISGVNAIKRFFFITDDEAQ